MTTQTPAVVIGHATITRQRCTDAAAALQTAVSLLSGTALTDALTEQVNAELVKAKAQMSAAAIAHRRLAATVRRHRLAPVKADVLQVFRFVGWSPVFGDDDTNHDENVTAAGLPSEALRITDLSLRKQLDILLLELTSASRDDLADALIELKKAAAKQNGGDAVEVWLHSKYLNVPGVVELLRSR